MTGCTAKCGTAVRAIALGADNAGQTDGQIERKKVVILIGFVKDK